MPNAGQSTESYNPLFTDQSLLWKLPLIIGEPIIKALSITDIFRLPVN